MSKEERLVKVFRALAESELGDPRTADVIAKKIIPIMDKNSLKTLKLAATLVNLATVPKYLKPFTKIEGSIRRKWIRELKPDGFTRDLVNLLEFILLASHYTREDKAAEIEYTRPAASLSPNECTQPRLSSTSRPKDSYDVIVIGSGAGGAVVTWSLVTKGFKVALFEIGPEPNASDLLIEHPVIRALKYYWGSGLTFTWGKPIISLPYGRVLGGTVTVNSGTLFRVPEWVLSYWYKVSGAKLSSQSLEEAYRVVENKLEVREVPEHLLGGNALVMRRGAESLGLSHGPVRRPLGKCRGLGECAFGCPCGGKVDMRLGFLKDAVKLGADVFTRAEVVKVIIKNGRAVGVKVRINDTLLEVKARAIVVSAGSLNTPKLLKVSGVKNGHLGKHLHIHPAAGVTGVMRYKVWGWRGTMQSYYVDDLLKDYHTLLLATFPPPGVGYSAASVPVEDLHLYPYMASIGVQTSDEGEGSLGGIRITGVATYKLNEVDKRKIIEGIKLAAEVLFAAGAERVYPPLKRGISIKNITEMSRVLGEIRAGELKLSAYHPMSTARMSGDKDSGVVDIGGRVYGTDFLYVADASIMPSTTVVNPQLTINALSLLVADAVAHDLGGPL